MILQLTSIKEEESHLIAELTPKGDNEVLISVYEFNEISTYNSISVDLAQLERVIKILKKENQLC